MSFNIYKTDIKLKLISLGRYLCWWTISVWRHHPSSRQCFGTDMVY